LERFEIDYLVHPDQTCCTGLGYYTDLMPIATTVAVAARNACVAADSGHPVMSYLCSTCYAINKKARAILEAPQYQREANAVLAKIGRRYSPGVAGTVQHRHVLEILWSAHRSIPNMVQRRLDGIKVATHPACHYCKVFPDDVVGDAENFMIPEDLLDGTGVIPTGHYNEKTLHCGRGFRQGFVNPGISMAVTREKLRRLAQEKIDVLVHMCPNCAVQFDRHHDIIQAASGEEYPFVHLHVQQLLALTLGADPDRDCGLDSHSQDVGHILERIGAARPHRAAPRPRDASGAAAPRAGGVS
jgi:heterodisulfide reductase subunit B